MTTPVRRVVPLGIVAGACLLFGASIVRMDSVPALLIPTALGVMCLFALIGRLIRWPGDPEATSVVARWTMSSFAVHLSFGIAITSSAAAISYFGGDAHTYHGGALGIVDHWQHGFPMPRLPGGKEGYYYLLAVLYWVFGPERVAGLAVNAVLTAALVPIVVDTTRRLFGPGAARFAPPLVVLVPGLIVWTSQLLKEAPVLFLLVVAANCGARLVNRLTLGPVLVLLVTLPLLLSFRGPVGVAVIGGIVGGVALGKRDAISGVVASVAVGGGIAVAIAFGVGSSGYYGTVQTDLEQANIVRRDSAGSATSGFALSDDISTTKGAISHLPRGLAGVTLGPFPWEMRNARQLIAVPDLIAWYLLIPYLWRGARAGLRLAGRRLLVLALPPLTITLLFSLVVSNYGTLLRERMQILVLLAPLIALGLAQRSPRSGAGSPVPDAQLVA